MQLTASCACTGACRVPPYRCGAQPDYNPNAVKFRDLVRQHQLSPQQPWPPYPRPLYSPLVPRRVGTDARGLPRYRVKAVTR